MGTLLRRLLFLSLGCAVLAAISLAGFQAYKKIGGNSALYVDDGVTSDVAAAMPDCDGKQLLRESPLKLEAMSQIIPLGNLAPPGHVLPTYHMYYNYVQTGTGADAHPAKTTLYVPADMTVTQMMKMDNADRTPAYDAYRIDFAICRQVTGYFILVQTLNDRLAAAMQPPYDRTQQSDTGTGKISHNWYKKVNIKLRAGEILGYAGGKPGDPDGLDVALVDARSPEPILANPTRWQASERHYVCSLDYYSPALSQQLYARLGDYYGNPAAKSANPCGSVYQDEPGTAQGVWSTGSASKEGLWDTATVAALVHSNFDPNIGVFSLGNAAQSAGLTNSSVGYFVPTKTGMVNLDFNLVDGGATIYCYEAQQRLGQADTQKTILLRLQSDTLTLGPGPDKACGSGPWQFGKTVQYER